MNKSEGSLDKLHQSSPKTLLICGRQAQLTTANHHACEEAKPGNKERQEADLEVHDDGGMQRSDSQVQAVSAHSDGEGDTA